MKLNISRVFTREEPVAGLEVGESALRLALLEQDDHDGSASAVFSVSERLPEGIIVGGAVADPAKFLSALQNIVKKAPIKVRYIILSIPGDAVYSKVLSFPKTIQGQKLDEAMKLAVDFQIPVKEADSYLDWERIESGKDGTDVLLAAIPKKAANTYIDAMGAAGLNTVAIESHPMSFARVMQLPQKSAALVIELGDSSGAIHVLKDHVPHFSRIIPFGASRKEDFPDEARKVKDFYEAEYGPISKEMALNDAEPEKEDQFRGTMVKNGGVWLACFGAAKRGLLPRSEDRHVSLMPVSTEQAYQYHKAIIFSEFISNLAVGISVFFAGAFFLSWIVMLSIRANTLRQLQSTDSLPVPSDAPALESQASRINDLTGAEAQALRNISKWSAAFSGVRALANPGIVVKNFSMPSLAGTITINGTANNASAIGIFKKTLASSTLISVVSFPPIDLNQTANIPFSVSFTLADPTTIGMLSN